MHGHPSQTSHLIPPHDAVRCRDKPLRMQSVSPHAPAVILAAGLVDPEGVRLSIVVPFGDVRGVAAHLDGWLTGQAEEARCYQLVVLTNGVDEALEKDILTRLRPWDLLHRHQGLNRFQLYSKGAEVSQAPILLFTEDHCIPEAGTVAAVLAHFDADPTAQAATLRGKHINRGLVARMEQLINEEDSKLWSSPGHWNKVRIRGFAIRTQVCQDAGGFDPRYSAFSEAILSGRLHQMGVGVGEVAQGGIGHINITTIEEIRLNARDYTWAECEFQTQGPSDFCARYCPRPYLGAWSELVPGPVARRLALAARKVHTRDRNRFSGGEYCPQSFDRAVRDIALLAWSAPFARWISRGKEWWARGRFALARKEAAQLRAMKDFWKQVVITTRLDHAAALTRQGKERTITGEAGMSFTDVGGHGVYGLESHEGRTFRWCSVAAEVYLAVAPGDVVVTIDTGGMRGSLRGFPVGLFWNGEILPRERVRIHNATLSFRVKKKACHSSGVQRLTMVAAPLAPVPGEPRMLGLPVFSITVAERQPKTGDLDLSAPVPQS